MKELRKHGSYYYEKRFRRDDGETFVKRYSRSYNFGAKKQPVQFSSDSASASGGQESQDVSTGTKQGNSSALSSASRAISRLKYLAFCNPDLKIFLTLTQRENISDEGIASSRFDNFRRLVKLTYPDFQFKFIAVKEYQKRGSIHWHILTNFFPFVSVSPNNPKKLVCDLWEYGFTDVKVLKGDDSFRPELYLLKYFTKESQKLFKQKYSCSRNLVRIEPRYIFDRLPIHPLATNIFQFKKRLYDNIIYQHDFSTKTDYILKSVAFFEVTEYYYNIKTYKGEDNEYII